MVGLLPLTHAETVVNALKTLTKLCEPCKWWSLPSFLPSFSFLLTFSSCYDEASINRELFRDMGGLAHLLDCLKRDNEWIQLNATRALMASFSDGTISTASSPLSLLLFCLYHLMYSVVLLCSCNNNNNHRSLFSGDRPSAAQLGSGVQPLQEPPAGQPPKWHAIANFVLLWGVRCIFAVSCHLWICTLLHAAVHKPFVLFHEVIK